MKKILIVDDDPAVRKLISVMLSKNGFDVMEAEDGKSAIRRLASEPADLVITDIFMPEKDGIETIRELKLLYPELKFMAMSGGGHYMDPTVYLGVAKIMGADVILDKPVAMQKLLQTIKDLFEAEIFAEALSS